MTHLVYLTYTISVKKLNQKERTQKATLSFSKNPTNLQNYLKTTYIYVHLHPQKQISKEITFQCLIWLLMYHVNCCIILHNYFWAKLLSPY